MKKYALLMLIGLVFSSCGNNNNPVDRPYIISQSQEQTTNQSELSD
jgi:hypothetical protein